MNWLKIESDDDLTSAINNSHSSPILLFKHSTRCSISSTAIGRIQRNWREVGITPYYLDLLNFRSISNKIAEITGVEHASPQAIVLVDGNVIYDATHFDIDFEEIAASIKQLAKVS